MKHYELNCWHAEHKSMARPAVLLNYNNHNAVIKQGASNTVSGLCTLLHLHV